MEKIKGYFTKRLLQSDEIYKSLIYAYMDSVIKDDNSQIIYTQFRSGFNSEDEFIYRAIHPKYSPFDEYFEIEMRVNDMGVFINNQRHKKFSDRYLYVLDIFKNKFNEEINKLQK